MRTLVVLGALLAASASTAAAQTTLTLASDAAYVAFEGSARFAKYFGAQARAGNNATNGDWEFAVVGSGTAPISSANGQAAWTGAHAYRFAWNGASVATFDPSVGTPDVVTASGVVIPAGGAVNAIVVRARNNGTTATVGSLISMTVNFAGGGSFDLGALIGDGDANYVVLVDDRLAGGFSVSGDATLQGRAAGSNPMYEFKVGQASVVPEPSTYALMATGLAGVVGLARRRRAQG